MPPSRSKESAEVVQEDVADDAMEDEEEGGIRIGDIYLPPPPLPACTFDSNGPRLVITHIENNFFKSYAGNQVLGPFHKSFTSIVGPNGSGKSNVIDSMLFVFGYRANKIRSKKISVLIHNSDQHPNVQSCTVAVHFRKIIDRDDSFDPVPNSEFCVSRTAFKDNSSFYQVDGKRCQFKIVAKLLRTHGIDLDHNRFLILQGEVEQISLMKPKALTEHECGMLEYLEDIVGSSRFKDPIDILSKRVEELNELRGEKLNRVKLVEKEKDELEDPKKEAVAYLRLENDVTLRKNIVYQKHIYDCGNGKAKAEAKKQEIDDSMKEIKEQLGKLAEAKVEKEQEIKEGRKKLEDITKTKESGSENFKILESEDIKLQEELKHKNQKRKKLITQLNVDKEKLEELNKIPDKSNKDIKECEALRETYEESRKKEEVAYHKAMESLNSETQLLQDEKEQYETKLIDLRKVVDETKSVMDIAQSELDIYQSTERNEIKKLEQIKGNLEKEKSAVSSRKIEVDNLKKEIPLVQKKIKEDQLSLQQIVPKLDNDESELRTQRAKLEEKRSAMTSSKSKGRVLDAIMEQKRNGTIPGIVGRLGDLGGIDGKYDAAISTACGPLDNIVVDHINTAQICINFLKKNDIGVATFIALDKMEKWRRNTESRIKTPENVPRLFDLVEVNDVSIKTAFYFALRDTLVAKDMDQARRIAYGAQRYRVVTLEGNVIEISGTMTGGGRASRGRMSNTAAPVNCIDPKEIQHAECRVEELTGNVAELRRKRANLEESLQRNSRDLQTMKGNLQKYERDMESSIQQINTLQIQNGEQEKKAKAAQSDKTKVSEMQKSIDIKAKSYKNAADAALTIEEKVNDIHKQIVEITGGKVMGMKKKLADLNRKLEKVNAEITRLQVAIKTSKRNVKKLEERISGAETEKGEVESELLGFKDKKNKIEEAASKIIEELKEISQEEEKVLSELGELKEIYDKITKKENKIKSSKIEQDQEIEKYEGIIKEARGKISLWKKNLIKLEIQEIPFDKDSDDPVELRTLDEEELKEADAKKLGYDLSVLEEKLAQAKPNLAVLQEYRKKEEVYLKRVSELDEITGKRDEQRKYHEDLRKQRLNEFMSGFTIISNKLKEMYQMITLGGDAELELVDSLDPFSEGIVFSVRPPKKSWKNITNLSGGEKTLSSLALVFALHYYKPTSLYVMDEIDAALDFKNVSIVGNYIKERTKNAQFIIISLRSQMFELADRLVGIYKTYNCTKSVTINPEKYGIADATQQSNKIVDTSNKSATQTQMSQPTIGVEM